MSILLLSDADIRHAITPAHAVVTQRAAYLAVHNGCVTANSGLMVEDRDRDTLVFAVTGAIRSETAIACKFGFQNPHNTSLGMPAVHAFVTLVDQQTGVPLACLNGTTITTMRTAAGIAAAAYALADPDSARLSIIGSGVQAGEAVRMITAIRPIRDVIIMGRSWARANALAESLGAELGVNVTVSDTVAAAADGADIVATCTSSREPVLHAADLSAGATVLTVGSYARDRREIALDVTERASTVYVDDISKASIQCGPVIEAAQQCSPRPAPIQIGSVFGDPSAGRQSRADVLVFHSVGLGVQDASLAWAVYGIARERGLGQVVDF